jgi:hypothetical protein
MSNTLKHLFVSVIPDGAQLAEIQPQRDWNEEHIFAGAATGALLYYDSAQSDHANWLAAGALGTFLRGGGAGAPATWSTLTIPATVNQGDLVVGTAANVMGVVAAVAVGQVLASAGVTTVPAYTATPTVTTVTASRTALVATSTDGVVAINTTPALVGTPVQISPRTRWTGTGWDTDDVVSRSVSFFAETLPVSAATVTGFWKIGYIDPVSAAITYPMTLDSVGKIILLGGLTTGSTITSVGAAAQLVLNNSAADAGVTGQAYFTLQTATVNRWYVGMSAGGATGNFDIYNNITAGLSFTINKTTHLVTLLGGLSVVAVLASGAITANFAGGGGLVLNNPTADAGVTGQAYMVFQTAGSNRWYMGMSANGSTGNFDLYNNIGGVNAVSIDKTTSLVTLGAALKVVTGFGCNGQTAKTAAASGGALNAYGAGANGFDTGANASALHALVVAIRAALVANGIMS